MLGKKHNKHINTLLDIDFYLATHREYVKGSAHYWSQAALIHKHTKSRYTKIIMSLCVLNEVREGKSVERMKLTRPERFSYHTEERNLI